MKRIDLGFAELEIHDRYVVGRTREGVEVDPAAHGKVLEEVRKYITPPFGFIVDEVNSYSIACGVLELIRNDPEIACCAAVIYRKITEVVLAPASRFVKKPYGFFDSLQEAEAWVLGILDDLSVAEEEQESQSQ